MAAVGVERAEQKMERFRKRAPIRFRATQGHHAFVTALLGSVIQGKERRDSPGNPIEVPGRNLIPTGGGGNSSTRRTARAGEAERDIDRRYKCASHVGGQAPTANTRGMSSEHRANNTSNIVVGRRRGVADR